MITSKIIMKKLGNILSESKISVSLDDAKKIGNMIGIDWDSVDLDQFRQGIQVEFEHGDVDQNTDVVPGTDSSTEGLIAVGKIALAHLKELPDYYTKLYHMEHGD